MSRRKRYFGCTVEEHRGVLRIRFRYQDKRFTRSTKLADTPENLRRVEKLAALIAAAIAAGRDPLEIVDPGEEGEVKHVGPTVRQYYDRWISDKVPPMVRRTQSRQYRLHIEKHILPAIGSLAIAFLTPRHVLRLRAALLNPDREGGALSMKYAKNIINGSLRAMCREAREIDCLIEKDPFLGVRWPRIEVPGPDPFTSIERDAILDGFARRRSRFSDNAGVAHRRFHPAFHVFVFLLFWSGLRPSEATGLQWGDVDLARHLLIIRRSRSAGEDNATKTANAARTVELTEETVRLLERIRPLAVTPDAAVFLNTHGKPINQDRFVEYIWHPMLRSLGIRQRGLYSTKDTFVSLALTAGVNVVWLEGQTGVSYPTLRKHYGRYVAGEGADQLRKMEGARVEDTDIPLVAQGERGDVVMNSAEGTRVPKHW